MGLRVLGLEFRGLGLRVWSFGVWGLGVLVQDSGSEGSGFAFIFLIAGCRPNSSAAGGIRSGFGDRGFGVHVGTTMPSSDLHVKRRNLAQNVGLRVKVLLRSQALGTMLKSMDCMLRVQVFVRI